MMTPTPQIVGDYEFLGTYVDKYDTSSGPQQAYRMIGYGYATRSRMLGPGYDGGNQYNLSPGDIVLTIEGSYYGDVSDLIFHRDFMPYEASAKTLRDFTLEVENLRTQLQQARDLNLALDKELVEAKTKLDCLESSVREFVQMRTLWVTV